MVTVLTVVVVVLVMVVVVVLVMVVVVVGMHCHREDNICCYFDRVGGGHHVDSCGHV